MTSFSRLPHVAKAIFVAWALAACGGGAVGDADADVDADADDDVSRDAEADTDSGDAADSGTDSDTLEYPICDPQFHDFPWGWGYAGTRSVERTDVEYEFVVTRMLETGFVAELDPEHDLGDEPQMSVVLPSGMAANVRLPELGDSIISLGGNCDDGRGYLRVTTPSGELIYEGGAPLCTSIPGGYPWPEPPRLSQRDVPSERCIDYWNHPPPSPEFCCVTRTDMEVVLHQPDGESVVVPGEDREIEIDGLRYLVSSQGAYWIDQGPDILDLTGAFGSAFIVRLDEP
jgi:hypothetical protein